MTRRRLDAELVRRELADSRTRAVALIQAGRVTVNGAVADKASRQVLAGDALVVAGEADRFVGRAGHKLEHALEQFGIDVAAGRGLDVGASTGGFTDCLLQRGATSVVALDVGYGQLHERLRADRRVQVVERTNIRDAVPDRLGGPFDIVTADLSFISLRVVLRSLVEQLAADGDLVVLVKPQFEAGKEEADRGRGVITDPAVWRRVLGEVIGRAEELGVHPHGLARSPITGAQGNVEFLLHLRRDRGSGPDPAELVAAAVDEQR